MLDVTQSGRDPLQHWASPSALMYNAQASMPATRGKNKRRSKLGTAVTPAPVGRFDSWRRGITPATTRRLPVPSDATSPQHDLPRVSLRPGTVLRPLPPGAPPELPATWHALCDHPHTDAVLLLHEGKRVFGPQDDDPGLAVPHALNSLSRPFIGALAGRLAAQGRLDLERSPACYVPGLADSGFARATVRDLLDMRSGVSSSVMDLAEALGFVPPTRQPPVRGVHALLHHLPRTEPPGGPHVYRTADTEALGWVLAAAGEAPLPSLLASELLQPMGAAGPATLLCDELGAPLCGGGLSMTLHDVGRFGLLLLNGQALGKQVLPPAYLVDTRHGNASTRQAFGGKLFSTPLPGGLFRNQTWVLDAEAGITLGFGAYGQLLFVDPHAQRVAVVFSSWPKPEGPMVGDWLRAFAALSGRPE